MAEQEAEKPESLEELLKALTDKERAFCYEYVKDFNGAKSARKAGYSETSAKEIAYENLTKPHISRVVSALCQQKIMSVDEGMIRLTQWGRGTFKPFLTVDGSLDLTSAEARKNIFLIKKVKQTKRAIMDEDDGHEVLAQIISTEIELHDPKDAVKALLEARGKLIKRIEHTGKDGEPLQSVTIFQLPDNGRNTAD